MIALSFMLVFMGFIALSLAMKRHFLQICPQIKKCPEWQVTTFRVIGCICLVSACLLCVISQGLAVGLVYWTGLLTIAALVQTLLLAYRPQWVIVRLCAWD